MFTANGRRSSVAALLGFAALALGGTAAAASQSAAVGSTAASSKAVLACKITIGKFQSDVLAAATARGAKEGTRDAAWRGAALKAATDWLRSGCLSIAP
jgi:hypothetical protein